MTEDDFRTIPDYVKPANRKRILELAAADDWVTLSTNGGSGLEMLYYVIGFDRVQANRSSGTDTTDIDPAVNVVDYLMLTGGW